MAASPQDQGPKRDSAPVWRAVGEVSAVGIEMALAIVVGYFGGRWLDDKLGTAPYLTYLMLVAGIGAAFKALWRVARREAERAAADESNHRGGDSG